MHGKVFFFLIGPFIGYGPIYWVSAALFSCSFFNWPILGTGPLCGYQRFSFLFFLGPDRASAGLWVL